MVAQAIVARAPRGKGPRTKRKARLLQARRLLELQSAAKPQGWWGK